MSPGVWRLLLGYITSLLDFCEQLFTESLEPLPCKACSLSPFFQAGKEGAGLSALGGDWFAVLLLLAASNPKFLNICSLRPEQG